MSNYLTEAFKKLTLLEEEVFNADAEGIEKFKAFEDEDNEAEEVVDIIDPDAEEEDELKDDYVGKAILDCCVCHSKIYKDKEDVIIDEEGDLANVEEECPFCFSNDGFKVVGEVAPFDKEEVEVKAENEDGDEEEVKVEVKDEEEKNESLKKAKRNKKSLKEDLSYGEIVAISDEWEKFKERTGRSDADAAWEFIETECEGVYDTDEEREEIFSYISTLEEGCHGRKGNKQRKINEAEEKITADNIKEVAQGITELFKDENGNKSEKAKLASGIIKAIPSDYADDLIKMFSEKFGEKKIPEQVKSRAKSEDVDISKFKTYGDMIQSYINDEKVQKGAKAAILTVMAIVSFIEPTPIGEIITAIITLIPANVLLKVLLAVNFPVATLLSYAAKKKYGAKDEGLIGDIINKGISNSPAGMLLGSDNKDEGLIGDAISNAMRFSPVGNILGENDERDDIDAIADDKKERAKAILNRLKDDADSDKDYQLKKHGLKEPRQEACGKSVKKKYKKMDEDKTSERDRIDATADDRKEAAKRALRRKLDDADSIRDERRASAKKSFRKAQDDADADRDERLKRKGLKESDKPAAISIEDAQKWVDYDMERYGRISAVTNRDIRKAGFQIIKDDHGDYEVTAGKYESLNEAPYYALEPRYDARQSFYGKAHVDTGDNDDKNRLYSYDTLVAEIKDGNPVVYGTYSQTTLRHIKDWLKQNGFKAETARQIMNDYGVKNESIETLSIDTGDQVIDVSARDKEIEEKVETEAETIKPVNDEMKREIEDNSEVEDTESDIEVGVDEFEDETFDEIGESFLKRSYNNIKEYKTTGHKLRGNKLKLEGVITFKSGNKKKTSFVFESKDITRDGKARFIGENLQICNGKKAFVLTGNLKESKFLPESLSYDFNAKDAKTGETKRVFGTVSKKRK